MNCEPSFKVGCHGYIIGALQRALEIDDDEIYGRQTYGAVRDLQRRFMMPETGEADEKVFKALKIEWPDEFGRCMQVVACFEGTGFGGVNSTDIDGAGVTLGLAGFTSKHGEVQKLLTEYIRYKPDALKALPSGMQTSLQNLISGQPGRKAWDNWFYAENGRLRVQVKDAVYQWGKDPAFQKLQLTRIYRDFWKPARNSASALGLRTIHGLGLMLDIQVQNGGWRKEHQHRYMAESQNGTEASKLRAIARAVADSSIKRWREDVMKRKMVFATGAGKVHGRFYDLSNYGFESVDAPVTQA